MERKIGEIFACDGVTLEVVEGESCDSCEGCYFQEEKIPCIRPAIKNAVGCCLDYKRKDLKSVIFKKL